MLLVNRSSSCLWVIVACVHSFLVILVCSWSGGGLWMIHERYYESFVFDIDIDFSEKFGAGVRSFIGN